jgi:hypothetical protein
VPKLSILRNLPQRTSFFAIELPKRQLEPGRRTKHESILARRVSLYQHEVVSMQSKPVHLAAP